MNKILCIRLDYLGDVLLCSPLLRSLKKRFPDAEIHFLSHKKSENLVDLVSNVDVWHFHQDNVRQTAAALWKEKFDLVIDFQSNSTSKWISFLLFRKTISIKPFSGPSSGFTHLIDHYFDALSTLQLENDGSGIEIKLNQTINLPSLPSKYDVFCLGARRVTRVISYPKMIELVNRWQGKLVLLGDSWDKNYADRLEILFPEKIINLCDQTTLVESAVIIKNAQKVVTHNSLMMHFAAALKKQPVVLFTNTSPSDGYGPYKSDFKSVMLGNLSCKPCAKLETDVCPLYHFDCGNKINLDAIFE